MGIKKLLVLSPLLFFLNNNIYAQNPKDDSTGAQRIRQDLIKIIENALPIKEFNVTHIPRGFIPLYTPEPDKTYEQGEVLITGVPEEDAIKAASLKEAVHAQASTISRGSPILSYNIINPAVNTQAPFLPGLVNNLNAKEDGTYTLAGFVMYGNPNGPYDIVPKFEGEPYLPSTIITIPASTKYDGLAVISTDFKPLDDTGGIDFVHSPFKSSLFVKTPGDVKTMFGGQIDGAAFYLKGIEGIEYYPNMYSAHARMESGNLASGKITVAGMGWRTNGSIDGQAEGAKFNIGNTEHHYIGIIKGEKLFSSDNLGDVVLRLGASHEDFTNSTSGFITDENSPSYANQDLGGRILSTTALFEAEFTNSTFGLRFNAIRRKQENKVAFDGRILDDAYAKGIKLINQGFDIMQEYANKYDTTSARAAETQYTYIFDSRIVERWRHEFLDSLNRAYAPYQNLSDRDKAAIMLQMMNSIERKYMFVKDSLNNIHQIILRDPITNEDTSLAIDLTSILSRFKNPEEYSEYTEIKRKLADLLGNNDQNDDQILSSWKGYYDGKIDLWDFQFRPSLSVDRIDKRNYASMSLSIARSFGDVTITSTASKISAPFMRSSINDVLRRRKLSGMTSRIYSLSGAYTFHSDFVHSINVDYLHKYFSENESGYDGMTKELDVSIKRAGDITYVINTSLGSASERDSPDEPYRPIKGSIDYTVKGLVSVNFGDLKPWGINLGNFMLINALNWNKGYYTNNTIDGGFVKSTEPLYWDLGVNWTSGIVEVDVGCTNIMPHKFNEAYRIVIINPKTGYPEVKEYNALTIPYAQLTVNFSW